MKRLAATIITLSLLVGPVGYKAEAAFPGDYTLYQEIEINPSKVPGDLPGTGDPTNGYIIYVDLSDMDVTGTDIWDTVRSDCGDIRITKSDGTTQLPREVVACNTTGKTGEMHVRYDGTLSSSATTTIRVWYNGTDTEPAASATYGSEAVWTDYDAVYHMQTTSMLDSTGNSYDGSVDAGVTTATGKLTGNALDFDSAEEATANNSISGTTNHTAQAWVQTTDSVNYPFQIGNDTTALGSITLSVEGSQMATRHNGGFQGFTGAAAADDGNWHMHHFQLNGTDIFDVAYYFDGSVESRTSGSDNTLNLTNSFTKVANAARGSINQIDELRITTNVLTANWITTEYNNQNSPSTFYFVSAEQEEAGSAESTPAYINFFSYLLYFKHENFT